MGGSPTGREGVQGPDVSSEMPTDPQDHPTSNSSFLSPSSSHPSIQTWWTTTVCGLFLTTGNMKDEGGHLGNRQGQTIKSWHGKCFNEAGSSCQGSDQPPTSQQCELHRALKLQVVLVIKNPVANAGDIRDTSSIPGSGRSPGEGRDRLHTPVFLGFPGGSDSRESTCNVGDSGSIPGLGRSLEESIATHSSILAWRILMNRGAWWATVHGVTKSQTRLSNWTKQGYDKMISSFTFTCSNYMRIWILSCLGLFIPVNDGTVRWDILLWYPNSPFGPLNLWGFQ